MCLDNYCCEDLSLLGPGINKIIINMHTMITLEKMSHICHILNVAVTVAPPGHIVGRKRGIYDMPGDHTSIKGDILQKYLHATLFGWQGRTWVSSEFIDKFNYSSHQCLYPYDKRSVSNNGNFGFN
jgi:hypothetical protein